MRVKPEEAFSSVLEELNDAPPILRHIKNDAPPILGHIEPVKRRDDVKEINPTHAIAFFFVAFAILMIAVIAFFQSIQTSNLRNFYANREVNLRKELQNCTDTVHALSESQEEACWVKVNDAKRECAIEKRRCLIDAESQSSRALAAEFQLELHKQGDPKLKADLEACKSGYRSAMEYMSELEHERDAAVADSLTTLESLSYIDRLITEKAQNEDVMWKRAMDSEDKLAQCNRQLDDLYSRESDSCTKGDAIRRLTDENKRLSEELAEAKRPRTPSYSDLIELIGGGTSVLVVGEQEKSGILIAKDFTIPEYLEDLFQEENGFRTVKVVLHR